MSYTLRGRLESRLAGAVLPLLAACVLAATLPAWWPLEVVGLMLGIGLALDVELYHRLLPYQPGWLALPLGALELALVVGVVRVLAIDAPLGPALALFGGSWLLSQLLGHAALPLWRLSYAEDGGELGRAGPGLAVAFLVAYAFAGGVAWATRPPTIHLASGIHTGPIVIDRAETLVGDQGAVVRGGIVVRADDVTVRDVGTMGGEYGIDVENAKGVSLERVTVSGATLDGIHVRGSSVSIRDCTVEAHGAWTQGIDISFGAGLAPSRVEGCTVVGGREGIVVDSNMAAVHGNRVSRTTLRAISMNEMSMGEISQNEVYGALGVGIYCGDYSECMVARNTVVGTRPDRSTDDSTRQGYGIVAQYGAIAELSRNHAGRAIAHSRAQLEPMR